jgi:hypothetical protein
LFLSVRAGKVNLSVAGKGVGKEGDFFGDIEKAT